MGTLIGKVTGNFTAAGTWNTVDNTATTGIAYQDTETNTTTLSTTASSNDSPAFLWAVTAPTIDAIAVKISSRAASPTGTFTLTLRNSDAGTDVASITINVSDIPDVGQGGWYLFKIGTQVLAAATNYKIRPSTSSSSQVGLYRSSTSNDWSRMLRTTTTAAPTTSDQLHVLGEWTAAATKTDVAVTMDETATTSYGPTVSGGPPQNITVGKGGTWQDGVAASTNYYFKFKGIFAVYPGGVLTRGASGGRMPSTSTSKYEGVVVTNVDTGFEFYPQSTVNWYGDNARLYKTLLNADLAAAGTGITVVATTGWAANDELVFTPTSATASQFEKKTASSIDSSTTATIAAATNAHSGSPPTQGYVGNITRNVQFFGTSTSLCVYVRIQTTATVVFDYASFYFIGSATTNKRGIEVQTTTGSCTINRCAIYDGNSSASYGIIASGGSQNNYTISDNVIYNMFTNAFSNFQVTTGTSWFFTGNLGIGVNASGSYIFNFADSGGTISDNIASGGQSFGGMGFLDTSMGTNSGNIAFSNTQVGMFFNGVGVSGTVTNPVVWRSVIGTTITAVGDLTITGGSFFGNTTGNINVTSGGYIRLISNALNGGATTVAAIGLRLTGASGPTIIEMNGNTLGNLTAHTSADIAILNPGIHMQIKGMNNLLSSTTELQTQSSMSVKSYIGLEKHDQTTGLHKFWKSSGTGSIDTTIYDTTPSLRLTPSSASVKLSSDGANGFGPFQVANGATLTVSIKVRESVVGDGTDYNGNPIRLYVKRNDALGITSDTLLATATAASIGAWETLSGTTAAVTDDGALEFYVDCDGTTGWVNIDTISITGALDSTGFQYWNGGFPVLARANTADPIGRIVQANNIGTY